MDHLLVLVRHGQSEWNLKNLFTGVEDVPLTDKGVSEAIRAGQMLKEESVQLDIAFTSLLQRAQNTLSYILKELGQEDLQTIAAKDLNERDYGELVGLNKQEACDKWGKEQVHLWRRSFDVPPPGGESLKNTAERVQPYYRAHILPHILAGKNVIVASHGNSLRSLIMALDDLTPDQVIELSLATGRPLIYRFNKEGSIIEKRDFAVLKDSPVELPISI